MSSRAHRLDALLKTYGHLPAANILPQLEAQLRQGHGVLTAPTGSGKTTLVPPALLSTTLFTDGKNRILMLEPRRIAARAAATRISEMLGDKVGGIAGYRTRVDSKISSATRIEVVTEGILIRQLQRDPELADYSLIIFDEFHERSLQADLGLALCYDLAQMRDDLRILVMSATLDAESICELLDDAPLLRTSGKSYPVEVEYVTPPAQKMSLPQQVVHTICHAWKSTPGDILAFLPGAGEIHQCQAMLKDRLPDGLILPLYGNLSHQEQDRIFTPAQNQRRVILATPIAETSLTIEHIGSVVDSGYYRRPVFDQSTGLTRLATFRISKSSAEQRRGRAGRMGPGHCYRLWSPADQHSLLDQTPPEIIGADLTSLVLELALWGITDPGQLRWLDKPRVSSWQAAVDLLVRLDLITLKGDITPEGKKVAGLPLHPRLGTMLVKATEMGFGWTASLMATLIAERDILTGHDKPVEIGLRLRLINEPDEKPLRQSSYDDRLCRRIRNEADKILKHLGKKKEQEIDTSILGTLLAFGYPDRIAKQRAKGSQRYLLSGGSGAQLPDGDSLTDTPFLVIPQLDKRQGDGRIFLAAPITEEDLFHHHSSLIKNHQETRWEKEEQKVSATISTRLGALTLKKSPLPEPDEENVVAAFLEGIRLEGVAALPWSKSARELQDRLCSLHHWLPQQWPDLSDEALARDLDWLTPYCYGKRSLSQLKGLDMQAILLSRFSWSEQQQLDRLAPCQLRVPSGSHIRLNYRPGEPPILAVRLQEMFGQSETPTVCQGSVPVLIHLLSPARRPMQVTNDLHSFWSNTYPEVRKELAGRYPKHYWPEDPLTASATSTTKKRMAKR